MPPKSKVKQEWLQCSETGVLYHNSCAEQHNTWLKSRDISESQSPATYPHISSSKFCGKLSVASGLIPSLPSKLAFSSVIIHSSVAKQCGIGQSTTVKVKHYILL